MVLENSKHPQEVLYIPTPYHITLFALKSYLLPLLLLFAISPAEGWCVLSCRDIHTSHTHIGKGRIPRHSDGCCTCCQQTCHGTVQIREWRIYRYLCEKMKKALLKTTVFAYGYNNSYQAYSYSYLASTMVLLILMNNFTRNMRRMILTDTYNVSVWLK